VVRAPRLRQEQNVTFRAEPANVSPPRACFQACCCCCCYCCCYHYCLGSHEMGGEEAGIRLGAAELWQTCREKQRQPRLKKQTCVNVYVFMSACNSRSIEPFPHVYGKAQILLGHPRQRGGGPFPTPSGQVLEHLLSSISPGGVAQALHRGRAAGSDLHSHGTGPEHQRPKNSPNGFPFFFEDLPWRSSKGRVMSTFPGFVYTYI